MSEWARCLATGATTVYYCQRLQKPTSKLREAGVGRRLGAEARGAIAPRLLKPPTLIPLTREFLG